MEIATAGTASRQPAPHILQLAHDLLKAASGQGHYHPNTSAIARNVLQEHQEQRGDVASTTPPSVVTSSTYSDNNNNNNDNNNMREQHPQEDSNDDDEMMTETTTTIDEMKRPHPKITRKKRKSACFSSSSSSSPKGSRVVKKDTATILRPSNNNNNNNNNNQQVLFDDGSMERFPLESLKNAYESLRLSMPHTEAVASILAAVSTSTTSSTTNAATNTTATTTAKPTCATKPSATAAGAPAAVRAARYRLQYGTIIKSPTSSSSSTKTTTTKKNEDDHQYEFKYDTDGSVEVLDAVQAAEAVKLNDRARGNATYVKKRVAKCFDSSIYPRFGTVVGFSLQQKDGGVDDDDDDVVWTIRYDDGTAGGGGGETEEVKKQELDLYIQFHDELVELCSRYYRNNNSESNNEDDEVQEDSPTSPLGEPVKKQPRMMGSSFASSCATTPSRTPMNTPRNKLQSKQGAAVLPSSPAALSSPRNANSNGTSKTINTPTNAVNNTPTIHGKSSSTTTTPTTTPRRVPSSQPRFISRPMPSPPTMTPSSVEFPHKCVPMKRPLPTKYQGDIAAMKDVKLPEFNTLVNFPSGMTPLAIQGSVPAGMKCCVMCGQPCPYSSKGKGKGGSNNNNNNSNSGVTATTALLGPSTNNAVIPVQNKGLCTKCDVDVWVVSGLQTTATKDAMFTSNDPYDDVDEDATMEIKWCKGCKNFRPWAAFGIKGLATKCMSCRDHQRVNYAMQKAGKKAAALKAAQKQQEKVRQMEAKTPSTRQQQKAGTKKG
eukprot:CAMPEP_0194028716 /NCGR_PEP_ID=MMETSP0009_2-20130614/2620_1 /TAXON_ID=210454 /ORGANISM="Grammatophora oceanica, Strain CCMP 410" /LENGTH=770 /DNA_ID=CAMNT_0038668185 /DNA_START=54 /DNA_END=2366 /DNA_ORIENTATION=-